MCGTLVFMYKNHFMIDSLWEYTIVWKIVIHLQYLPPMFVQKVQQFIGQRTLLVDSTGRQWPVKISSIDGYLAFKKGWHEFAIDHGLEFGHLLIFSYVKGGNFDVRIYGRSGREIVNFNSRRGIEKKRSRQGQEKILLKNPFGMYFFVTLILFTHLWHLIGGLLRRKKLLACT